MSHRPIYSLKTCMVVFIWLPKREFITLCLIHLYIFYKVLKPESLQALCVLCPFKIGSAIVIREFSPVQSAVRIGGRQIWHTWGFSSPTDWLQCFFFHNWWVWIRALFRECAVPCRGWFWNSPRPHFREGNMRDTPVYMSSFTHNHFWFMCVMWCIVCPSMSDLVTFCPI